MSEANEQHINGRGAATRKKILRAAEKLFAENGFEATSLRMITAAAGVNLAAVNYHFHTKDDLIRSVFEERLRPLNHALLEGVHGYRAALGARRPRLEEVLRVFLEPALRLRAGANGVAVGRLLGRTYVETSRVARDAFFDRIWEIAQPFMEALRRALPGVSEVDLIWNVHFAAGVMAHTMAGTEHLKVISGGRCDAEAGGGLLERVVAFIAAGMRALARRSAAAGKRA